METDAARRGVSQLVERWTKPEVVGFESHHPNYINVNLKRDEMKYAEDKRMNIKVGDKIFMNSRRDFGHGTVIKVNKKTIWAKIGNDIHKRVNPKEFEFERRPN